jgi:hypothetical protein
LSGGRRAGSIRHRVTSLAAFAPLFSMRSAVVLSLALALAAPLAASAVAAATIGGNPGPEHNYVCPHADGQPSVECFFDAIQHLYTMCRNVKAIEIILFGYEKSTEGTNGAKSEYCLDKQKQNIERPYRAALKDALRSKQTVEALRGLHEFWLSAMTQLAWRSGESDDDYKSRVAKPYDDFRDRIASIRTVFAADKPAEPASGAAKGRKAKPAAKAKKP